MLNLVEAIVFIFIFFTNNDVVNTISPKKTENSLIQTTLYWYKIGVKKVGQPFSRNTD